MIDLLNNQTFKNHVPWNKGKLVGQKPPLILKEIWAVRIRLQLTGSVQGDCDATEDRSACTVRVDRTDKRGGSNVDNSPGAWYW